MKEYINKRYDESVLNVLEELRRDAIYSCSDPRLPIKEHEQVNKFTKDAAERHKEDFENLHETIDDYLSRYGCIPYCVILPNVGHEIFGSWFT